MPDTIHQMLNMARSGMLARLIELDVVSANLANVNTVGFKRNRTNFQELLNERAPGGVQIRATQLLMGPGRLQASSNPLDLAIEGEGFFAVRLPDGRTAYTRDGQFRRDAAGQLVTVDGYHVVWEGQIPDGVDDVHVNPDGTLMIEQGEVWSQTGTIGTSRFTNPSGLVGYGHNLWLASEASGAPVNGTAGANGFGQIVGNAVESSNVNLTDEMTRLITLQQAYDLSVRAFQQTDLMLSQAIQLRRG